MDSLSAAPIADLLKQLFQKAEVADRPLLEAFSSEGEEISQEQLKKILEDEAKDYRAVYRSYVRDPRNGYLSLALPFEAGRGNEFTEVTR